MLKSYLKIAKRNLFRNKAFSIINVLGLAMGMASALLIILWINDELGIGRYYKNTESLYRVMEREFTDGKIVADEDTPGLLADELKRLFPEIQYSAGLSWSEDHLLTAGNVTGRFSGNFAGVDLLIMYEVPILSGKTDDLAVRGSIALSRKLAENYFGGVDKAVGKAIQLDNHQNYQVAAVFEDLPYQSSDKYEYLLSWADFLNREPWLKVWSNYGPATRIMLRPDRNGKAIDAAALGAKIKWFMKGRDDSFGPTYKNQLFLVAEKNAYLYANYTDGYQSGGRAEYVLLLGIVAGFLLLIASINFMNLSTARSVKRAMEVGVRKVVGAGRYSLIGQFLSESFLLTSIACLIALTTVMLTLPTFNQLTGKQIQLPLENPAFWLGICVLLSFTGLLAGSYPALVLSGFNPARVLKGTVTSGINALRFRKGLVVFQFVLSMIMIVGTVIIYQQLQYFQNKNLGFERENLIRIRIEGDMHRNYPAFKEELSRMAGINSITHVYTNPLRNGNTTEGVTWPGKDPNSTISFNNTAVGLDFVKTMRMKLIEGRDFSPEFISDSSSYLINEAAAKRIGYKNPVGQPLTFWDKPGKIIGFIEDFHFNSLHEKITPMIIRLADNNVGNVIVRTQPGQTKEALASIESVYKKLNPKFPFTYSFIDSDYEKLYRSEDIVGVLSAVFACIAIFIACLGLFGLAAFSAEQRTKEIGVRKVLGASVTGIVALLSGDFLKLVCIAIIVSSPIAWFLMHKWLENFAYKIDIHWWIFPLAGLIAISIALLTVCYQSIRAALTNPVKSLKTE